MFSSSQCITNAINTRGTGGWGAIHYNDDDDDNGDDDDDDDDDNSDDGANFSQV